MCRQGPVALPRADTRVVGKTGRMLARLLGGWAVRSYPFGMSQTTPAEPGEPTRYGYIDAVRGWAILGVIAVHTSYHSAPLPEPVWQVVSRGNYGVQLFFVASAVTLLFSYEARRNRDARPVRAFFVRRFFRIAPLLYLGIPFYLWWYGCGPRPMAPDGVGWVDVVATVCFANGWRPEQINAVVPGVWSVAAEVSFYLLAPVLFSLARTPRQAATLFAAAWALAVAVRHGGVAAALFPAATPFTVNALGIFWFPNQLPVFLLGVLTYHLIRTPREAGVGYLCLAAAVVASDAVPLAYTGPVFYGALAALFVLGLSTGPYPLLDNRVTRSIGVVSFAGYVSHFAVIDVVRDALGSSASYPAAYYGPGRAGAWFPEPLVSIAGLDPVAQYAVMLAAVVAGTVAVSAVLHAAVERPGIGAGRWLLKRLRWQ
ncbi:acyltransferase 3 : Acyltransferase OS=Pseudomonas taiwanensis SJ9 GN=O164_23910 PE=4 SV=1: Acyl_transf_3 [Gemmataceae bacterium]|nr:acyltransferase 3 : Acyltransferase OS=Pseudomonas taiwanensis SJ9 GN=O164_23910 PE=4 SV=1: Acyl_transf_3 [Gemmataceae bacterium]VTU02539.1 acyltransferase 3 : Acyltransferase OS=Pseudomonas taiwanensis SJ9 GN=O164_23910 PE=4 SV=1: Acyl_transf_3 [Gemmataceae bacterium]